MPAPPPESEPAIVKAFATICAPPPFCSQERFWKQNGAFAGACAVSSAGPNRFRFNGSTSNVSQPGIGHPNSYQQWLDHRTDIVNQAVLENRERSDFYSHNKITNEILKTETALAAPADKRRVPECPHFKHFASPSPVHRRRNDFLQALAAQSLPQMLSAGRRNQAWSPVRSGC